MHQYLGSIHCQVFNALINIFHTALLLELLGAVFLIPELLTKLTMPQWARFKLCSSMFMFSTHPCTHSPNIYKDTYTPILFLSYMYLFTNMNLDAIQVQCSGWDCFAGQSLSRPAVATQTCGYCRFQLLTGVHCTADHGSGASPKNIFTFYQLFEGLDDGGSTSY